MEITDLLKLQYTGLPKNNKNNIQIKSVPSVSVLLELYGYFTARVANIGLISNSHVYSICEINTQINSRTAVLVSSGRKERMDSAGQPVARLRRALP